MQFARRRVEEALEPPYRAEAVRRHEDLWTVAARRIQVVDEPGLEGEEVELTCFGGHTTLVVDGTPTLRRVDALTRVGEDEGAETTSSGRGGSKARAGRSRQHRCSPRSRSIPSAPRCERSVSGRRAAPNQGRRTRYPVPMPAVPALDKVLRFGEGRRIKRLQEQAAYVATLEPDFQTLSDDELRAKTVEFRQRLDNGEELDNLLFEAYAAVREARLRESGERLFDVQMMGGIVLHEGDVAEMKTGEGKTYVASLALYLNALPARGVHLVTVNDYLARRDAAWNGGVYERLGVTVDYIENMMPFDRRKQAYASDITTARTRSSASTTSATTCRSRSRASSSAATRTRSWTRSTRS